MSINDLPPELLSKIFSFLTFDEIVYIKDVSVKWRDHILSSPLWYSVPVLYQEQYTDYEKLLSDMAVHSNLIRNVVIGRVEVTSSIREILNMAPNVRSVQIKMSRIDAQTIKTINKLKNLTALSIINCYRITNSRSDEWDIDFKSLSKLKVLCLSDFGLKNSNFDGLLSCHNLTHLDIRKVKDISQEKVINFINAKKDKLKKLCIYGGDSYDDEITNCISNCSNIREICILRSEKLTDKSLLSLRQMDLYLLMLWNNRNFTEKGLQDFFSHGYWINLKCLSFSKIENLTKSAVVLISEKCKNISFLGIYMCRKLSVQIKRKELIDLFPKVKLFYEYR